MPPANNTPTKEDDRWNAAQPWLDFGRWLAGEVFPDDCSCPDGISQDHSGPSFTEIMQLFFHDIARDALLRREQESHGRAPGRLEWHEMQVETRHAMHRRFIRAVHLAFGAEDLRDIAIAQPSHVFRLVEHMRADFGLLPFAPLSWDDASRLLHGSPVCDRMCGTR